MCTTRIRWVSAASAIMFAAGCQPDRVAATPTNDSQPAESVMRVVVGDENNEPTEAGLPATTIAALPSGAGGTVTFHDLGDGVAISEVAPMESSFVSTSLLHAQEATPLEVYLALQSSAGDVPTALVRDHEKKRGRGGVPRSLTFANPADLPTPGLDPYFLDCPSFDLDWPPALLPHAKYAAATQYSNRGGSVYFYPGSHVYNGTNTNSKTYLGVCTDDNPSQHFTYDPMLVEIHRRYGSNWNLVVTLHIVKKNKYTFYSAIPAAYRGRTALLALAPDFYTNRVGLGAAWTISPGVGY